MAGTCLSPLLEHTPLSTFIPSFSEGWTEHDYAFKRDKNSKFSYAKDG